jgi:cell fate regulator YaaT (PSP1 superfamily)
MPIVPLPQFEADLEADRKAYEALKPPTTVVARFGVMKMVGEFPFDLDVKPGCGSKLVLRTHRGTEIGEMLTSTCPNSGCSKSVTRKEMLEYIENSGGKDYPFFSTQTVGGPSIRVLRIATVEDLNVQARLDETRRPMVLKAREFVEQIGLPIKMVEAEPILGQERITFYFNSEERIDFRELVHRLSEVYHTRIELRQIGARDEARLTADYERCGQHCCCKQFLKVLKPISMKAAKVQKATLDPLKISGRCGRLMCCLRYEDQTYTDLAKRLPRKKSRVNTPEGSGTVLDGQILTQLVLVQLDHEDRQVAVPVEEIEVLPPGSAPVPRPVQAGPGGSSGSGGPAQSRGGPGGGSGGGPGGGGGGREDRGRRPREPREAREGGPRPDANRGRESSEIPDIMEIGGDGAVGGAGPDAAQRGPGQGRRGPIREGREPQGRERDRDRDRRDRGPRPAPDPQSGQPGGGPGGGQSGQQPQRQGEGQGQRPEGRREGRGGPDGRSGPGDNRGRDGRGREGRAGRPRDDRPRDERGRGPAGPGGAGGPGAGGPRPDRRGEPRQGPGPQGPGTGPASDAGPPTSAPPPPSPPSSPEEGGDRPEAPPQA